MKYMCFLKAISKFGNLQYNGLNTNDATAEVNDIVNAKTAYVNAEKITGNLAFDGNATVNDVVASKTFFSDDPQTKLTGVVASLGATTYTPTTANQAIVNKYLTGLQTIKGDANLIPENIKYGTTLFNVLGSSALITNGIAYTSFNESGEITTAKVYGTKVYNSALANLDYLTSVDLQEDVTQIGENAFYGCQLLNFTSLPNSITTIKKWAFASCFGLTLDSLPSSLTTMGEGAFNNCKYLELLSLPSGITVLEDNLFAGSTYLALETLPSGLTEIGVGAFYLCPNIVIEALPNGLTKIDYAAFSGCTSLTKIWIPDTCITINAPSDWQSPFYNCSPSLHIYCEASSKPVGWGTYWNYYDNTNQLTVTWSTTLEAFNAL